MQNDKLLPCPCCESEIKGGVRLTGYLMMNRQYIKCDTCGLTMETKYTIDGATQEQLKTITKELITRWNTRKPMEQIVEQLEEESKFILYEMNEPSIYAGVERAIEIVKGGVDNG